MIINGKEISQSIKDCVKAEITEHDYKPLLVVIQVGDNPASSTYVKNKTKACEYCGIEATNVHLMEDVTEEELLAYIDNFNQSPTVNGILVQLPLPAHINEQKVLNAISPDKDVDGFHPVNVAKLWTNDLTAVLPCTPKGIIKLIESTKVPISGKKAVVIGRSNIVGKPVAKLLMDKGATVTICHSKTPKNTLISECSSADIIVVAIGKANFLTLDYITNNAGNFVNNPIIIDVGINRNEEGKLCGDVKYDEVLEFASWITPVPGGVGPMTIACLMENTLECYKRQNNL